MYSAAHVVIGLLVSALCLPFVYCTEAGGTRCDGGHCIRDTQDKPNMGLTLLQGLTNRGMKASQGAHASLAADGQSVHISFMHDSQMYNYDLAAYNPYAEGASILQQTGSDVWRVPSGQSRRVFRTRKHGKWASATVHADGSVSGIFEDDGQVFEVQPAEMQVQGTAMLETDASHRVRRVNVAELLHGFTGFAGTNSSQAAPYKEATDAASHFHWENASDDPATPSKSSSLETWGGVPWYPGCYAGDDQLHTFVVGFIADEPAHSKYGDELKPMMEAILNQASFVYEMQLNIRLEIGFLHIYTTTDGAPSWASGCEGDFMGTKFQALTKDAEVPRLGSTHLFTGCGTGFGTVGKAWVGSICDTRGYACGINQIHGNNAWLTFAHELGHNFNGDHSFEDGQGKTGGIMDYGDGKFENHYQFNSQYRKAEMCQEMSATVGKCNGNFDVAFVPVDGGVDRACRGANAADNLATYYVLVSGGASSIEMCKSKCQELVGCKGVEYKSGSGRCELWTRDGGILASVALSGYTCLRLQGSDVTTTNGPDESGFEPVDGGDGRACRGASANDNLDSYFSVFGNVGSLDKCKERCKSTYGCVGVEHYASQARCEVWTREGGIGASVGRSGFVCLRFQGSTGSSDFLPVDGGVGRACRGASESDNLAKYFSVVSGGSSSLEACQSNCRQNPDCKGVEYSIAGRCELWTREGGIQSSIAKTGFTCMRYDASAPTLAPTPAPTPVPTPVATPSSEPTGRVTTSGCACLKEWQIAGATPCTNFCCNPDSDSNGEWCFVDDATCTAGNWGYCAPGESSTPEPTATSTVVDSSGSVSQMEWEHFGLLNDLRQVGFTCPDGKGHAPNSEALQFDCRLWRASYLHSKDMADNNFFSHFSPDARSPWDRAEAQGISANAENIAAGASSAQGVLEQWKTSNGHCENMMNPDMKLFAIGYAFAASSRFKHLWTQMLSANIVPLDTSCYPSGAQSSSAHVVGETSEVLPVALDDPWFSQTNNQR